jgi:hypothetical protein
MDKKAKRNSSRGKKRALSVRFYPLIRPKFSVRADGCFRLIRRTVHEQMARIDETMRPVIVLWDGEPETALAILRGADIPPGWVTRRFQQYTVSIPESVWKAMFRTGAIEAVNPNFGDRFMVLASNGLYDDNTGLRLDDPTARTAEENVF